MFQYLCYEFILKYMVIICPEQLLMIILGLSLILDFEIGLWILIPDLGSDHIYHITKFVVYRLHSVLNEFASCNDTILCIPMEIEVST